MKDDTISRQAAIDALISLFGFNAEEEYGSALIETLNSLPSVQSEPTGDAEFWRKRADYYSDMCMNLIGEMGRGVKIESVKINENGIEFFKEQSSAQSEPIRINLNEPIKVKLTDWGKEIYYHQYDRVNQIVGRNICKPRFPKEDKNGYTEFQLWCFMELYGEHMRVTLPSVIEPLEIVYER